MVMKAFSLQERSRLYHSNSCGYWQDAVDGPGASGSPHGQGDDDDDDDGDDDDDDDDDDGADDDGGDDGDDDNAVVRNSGVKYR